MCVRETAGEIVAVIDPRKKKHEISTTSETVGRRTASRDTRTPRKHQRLHGGAEERDESGACWEFNIMSKVTYVSRLLIKGK